MFVLRNFVQWLSTCTLDYKYVSKLSTGAVDTWGWRGIGPVLMHLCLYKLEKWGREQPVKLSNHNSHQLVIKRTRQDLAIKT